MVVVLLQLLQLAVVLQLLLLLLVVLHLLQLAVVRLAVLTAKARVLVRVLQLMALVVWRRRGGCLRDVRERPYRRC